MATREIIGNIFSNRTARIAVLSASLVAAACGSDKQPAAKPLSFDSSVTLPSSADNQGSILPPATLNKCTVKDQAKWQSTPTNVDAEHVAQALDVSVAAIHAGHFGAVACESGLTTADIREGNAKIDAGVGSPCLAIGTMDAPDPAKSYTDLLVVCAAKPG